MDAIGGANFNMTQSFDNNSFNVNDAKYPDHESVQAFENLLGGDVKPAACSLSDPHSCGGVTNDAHVEDIGVNDALNFSLNQAYTDKIGHISDEQVNNASNKS